MPGKQTPQPMTLTQKILAHHAVTLPRPWAQTGDMLRIRVDWTIASELAWNGMDRTYTLLGRPKIANPDRFYLALDHTVEPEIQRHHRRACQAHADGDRCEQLASRRHLNPTHNCESSLEQAR